MKYEKKKILIITYYWPPSAGVGVQRWLKMSQYLKEVGYEPIIFTPENPDFNVKDESLLQKVAKDMEVIRFPIWEPFQLFHKLTGGKQKSHVKQGLALEKTHKSWKDKLSVWIRGNAFVPDPRVFWVRPAVKFLLNHILKDNNIQAVVTTGPPHSMHLIGLQLKKKTGMPWIADFRDPWSKWDLLDQLKVTKLVQRLHERFERAVLKKADRVLTVSPQLAEDLAQVGNRSIEIIYNGVDRKDLAEIPLDKTPPKQFKISHIGLMNETRNPVLFWEALNELLAEVPGMSEQTEVYLAGLISESIVESLQKKEQLAKVLKVESYIAHKEVFEQCATSAIQLIILNNTDNARWILPSKMYEYLAVGRPVLLIGPEGSDAGGIINQYGAGTCLTYDDKAAFKKAILAYYEAFKKGEALYQDRDISQYTREHQAGEVARLLEEIIPEQAEDLN